MATPDARSLEGGRATIAGIEFLTDVELVGLSDSDPSDASIEVRWVDAEAAPTTTPLGAPSDLIVWVDETGVTLPIIDEREPVRSWQLRQVAPVIAAWLGHLTLHASAVSIDGGAVAFVGASEVGKSTLAWELTKAGAQPLADDLVPVRFTDDSAHTVAGVPVSTIAFLTRGTPAPRVDPIADKVALMMHLRDGFGEHDDPRIRGEQFAAYHRLIEVVPHVVLTVPETRERLTSSAPELVTLLSPGSGT